MMNRRCQVIAICLLACIQCSYAATRLESSHNEVKFSSRSVSTGSESRAELSNDRATFRVGANSDVKFGEVETANLDLKQGVVMVDTQRKGLGRKSLTVETKEITATTNATMMISYQPGRYIKIVCTSGKVKVTLKGLGKESVTIRKGQMLIINCLENVLPSAVSVDLSQLMQSSPLFAAQLRGGPARDAAQRRSGPSGGGRPPSGEAGNARQDDSGPLRGNRPPPPPPSAAPQNFRLLNPQGRPQPVNLAVRRIDCMVNPNAIECMTAARPAMNSAAMAQAGANAGQMGAPAMMMASQPQGGGGNGGAPMNNPPPSSNPPMNQNPPPPPSGGSPPR